MVDLSKREELLFGVINETAEQIFQNGNSIDFDMNGGSEAAKKAVTERERKHNVTSVWLTFDISENEIKKRLESRSHKIHNDAEHAFQNYLEQKQKGEEYFAPLHPAVYTFVDGDLDPQLDKAESAIRSVFAD